MKILNTKVQNNGYFVVVLGTATGIFTGKPCKNFEYKNEANAFFASIGPGDTLSWSNDWTEVVKA